MHVLKPYGAKQNIYHSLNRIPRRKLVTFYYYGKEVSGSPQIFMSALQIQEMARETKEAQKS